LNPTPAARQDTVQPAATLLERDEELERLSAQIRGACAGSGATVAVEGVAGIGKSALLAVAAELAAKDMLVLRARGGELERDLPYGVVRQLFERELGARATADRERLLGGQAALAAPALAPSDDLRATADAGVVAHGLYWLTANLCAQRPLLLVIDDAHWSDPASVGFMSYVARRAEPLALLLLYATRTHEGHGDDLPGATDARLVSALRPRPLSAPATAELIRARLGEHRPASLAAACHRASGGNPYLLNELVTELATAAATGSAMPHVADVVPPAIVRATLVRLRRLGAAATQLAFAVAVLGTNAELRHAAALAGMTPEEAGDSADALIAAGILTGGPGSLDFAHPLLRTAVHAEIAPGRLTSDHRRAAALLAADGTPAEALAPHLLACAPDGDAWVVEQLRAAATAVLRRGAPGTACELLERALREPPAAADAPAVLLALGSVELRAGRSGAINHLRDALAGVADVRLRADAAQEMLLALVVDDRGHEAVDLFDETVAQIAETDADLALRLDAELIALAQVDPSTAPEATRRLAFHRDRGLGATAGERLLLAGRAFDALLRAEPCGRAVELAELALSDGRLLGEQLPDSPAFQLAIMPLILADELDRAEHYAAMSVADAQARGSLLGISSGTAVQALALLGAGRVVEAETLARAGLEAAGAWPHGRPLLGAMLTEALLERDRPDAGEALLAEEGLDGELPSTYVACLLLHSRGHLRLAAGDPDAALRDFEELHRRGSAAGLENLAALPARSSAAAAHAALGRRDAALAAAREGMLVARRWGARSALAFALRTLAHAEGGDQEIPRLREAVATVAGSPARREHARSLVDLGATLTRAGLEREARAPLREALDLADGAGLTRLAAIARAELVAAGGRPRRSALKGRDSLTGAEARIAALAADGLANREIADALFLTVRTVEGHLTNVYRKLEIRGRLELAARLDDPVPATVVRRDR